MYIQIEGTNPKFICQHPCFKIAMVFPNSNPSKYGNLLVGSQSELSVNHTTTSETDTKGHHTLVETGVRQ